MRDNSGFRVRPGTPTLATRLKARGFATGAFVGGFPLTKRFGLTPGFDVYDDQMPEIRGAVEISMPERRADVVVTRALDWIGKQPSRFFSWVHVFDPHSPYKPPADLASEYSGAAVLRRGRVRRSGAGSALRQAVHAAAADARHRDGRSWREPRRARRAHPRHVRLRGDAARPLDRRARRAGALRCRDRARRRHARPPHRHRPHRPRGGRRGGGPQAPRAVAAAARSPAIGAAIVRRISSR